MKKIGYLTLTSLAILGGSSIGIAADTTTAPVSGLSAQSSGASTDLSLADILNLEAPNVASLIGGTLESAPATVNVFTAADIAKTPSRTLTDFLDKSLPGFDSRDQMWVTPVWGFRGILNDRNESILMNVNGEMQNNLSKAGIQGETVLGLMGDIKQVQTISGPASVIHGPGALSGVINLELKDGRDEPSDKTDRVKMSVGNQGDISSEYAHVARFDGDRVLRVDGGFMAHHHEYNNGYVGPDSAWAAQEPNGHDSGRKWPGNYRLTSVYTDKPANFRAWFRYTSMEYDVGLLSELEPDTSVSGTPNSSVFQPAAKINNGDSDPVLSRRHYQRNLSMSADKTIKLSSAFELKTTAGTTITNSGIMRSRNGTQFGRNNPPWNLGLQPGISWDGDILDAIGEARLRLRTDLRFINDSNPFVVGAEIRNDRYGANILGDSFASSLEWGNRVLYPNKVIPDVNYVNFSAFGEYKNQMIGKWLVPNLGARLDAHTIFTTFAPRVALTGTVLDNHNYRLVWQQAYKALSADNINGNMEASNIPAASSLKPASNTSYEIGYQFKKDALTFGGDYFTNHALIYTWDDNIKSQVPVPLNTSGFELNAAYNAKDFAIKANHAHTGLDTDPRVFVAKGDTAGLVYSQDGTNLFTFSPDITRFQVSVPYGESWETTLTSRVIWGNSGIAPEVNATTAVPNMSWLTTAIFKLDLQVVRQFASSRLAVNFENLAGFFSDQYKGRFASSFSGSTHDLVLELVDKPRVQVSYILQF